MTKIPLLPYPLGCSPPQTREESAILRAALGSGKLRIEGSLSFKRAQAALQVETEISIRAAALPAPGPRPLPRGARFAGSAAADSPKHEGAALRLQKVYKSFRTRRQLADYAVLVEQSWWKLLDFALLKCSSVSFFEVLQRGSLAGAPKQQTKLPWRALPWPCSCGEQVWARRKRKQAARYYRKSPQWQPISNFYDIMVGKGLLKDENAQKLALQHWLEAAALEEILYQFEEKLQAEREEAARKQEELQAQLQAQQAALEENQSLLRQAQEEVKGMHTKFEETNALL
uniref:Uncharacterized protein n=1 Tax=Zea mays TaxID=4577 RepID=Q6J9V2_MAIZE|nr:hypothetical protein Z273B07_Z409L08.24 [Zea mays]